MKNINQFKDILDYRIEDTLLYEMPVYDEKMEPIKTMENDELFKMIESSINSMAIAA